MSSVVCRYVKSRSDNTLLTVGEAIAQPTDTETSDMHYHLCRRSKNGFLEDAETGMAKTIRQPLSQSNACAA